MTSSKLRTLDPCLVCGGQSIGFNFGVLTCMACKAFFRRNAVKLGTYEFTCPKDGDCPITHEFRRLCNCCRLAKCFHVGMQRALILSDEEKEARRQVIEQNRQRKLEKSFTTVQQPMTMLRADTQPSSCLSAADQELLRNVFNAYQSTCVPSKSTDLVQLPSKVHSSVYELFQEYSGIHLSVIKYLTRVPHFQALMMDNKLPLLRDQISIVNNVNATIVHQSISENLILSLRNIFGPDLATRLLQCIERIQEYTSDPILLKLLLIIITFSSGNCLKRSTQNIDPVCLDMKTIFIAQNVFVELLWKYISVRTSREDNAIRLWMKLIQSLLYVQDVHLLIDECISEQPREIEQLEPLLQSMWPSN